MALIEQKGTISAFGEIREGTGKSGYHWQRQNIVLEYQVGESYTEHLVVTADADGHAVISIGPAFRTVWYEVAVKGK